MTINVTSIEVLDLFAKEDILNGGGVKPDPPVEFLKFIMGGVSLLIGAGVKPRNTPDKSNTALMLAAHIVNCTLYNMLNSTVYSVLCLCVKADYTDNNYWNMMNKKIRTRYETGS